MTVAIAYPVGTAHAMPYTRGPDVAGWQAHAECLDMDPETFFPDLSQMDGPEAKVALDACERCPVVDACLQHALDTGDAHSIRGGTTPAQRRAMQRRSRAAAKSK